MMPCPRCRGYTFDEYVVSDYGNERGWNLACINCGWRGVYRSLTPPHLVEGVRHAVRR